MTVREVENTTESWESGTHTHTHTFLPMQNTHRDKHAFPHTCKHTQRYAHTSQTANTHISCWYKGADNHSLQMRTHAHTVSLLSLPSQSPWSCDDGDGEQCVLTVTVTQSCIQHMNLRGKRFCFKSKTSSLLLQCSLIKFCEVSKH